MVLGRCDERTLHPDLDWLEAALAQPAPPRVVVICNPCNPTGVMNGHAVHDSPFSCIICY